MSLEQSVNELNSNIVKLIAVMSATGADVPRASAAQPAKAPAASAPAAKAETKAAPAPAAKAPAAVDQTSDAYKKASTAVTALAKAKGRDAAIKLLGEFGASKLPDVDPSQYDALIEKANAQALAEAA